MKIKSFVHLALLLLLMRISTGCEKFEYSRREFLRFSINGVEMIMKTSEDFSGELAEHPAIYDTAADSLYISAVVGPRETEPAYLIKISVPHPSSASSCSITFETYEDREQLTTTAENVVFNEFQLRKKFAGYTLKDSKIVKKYNYSGGYVSGGFRFSGENTVGEKTNVWIGQFVLRLYCK